MNRNEYTDLHEKLDSWLLQELKEKTGRTSRNEEEFCWGIRKNDAWIAGIEGRFLFETCYLDLLAADPSCRSKGLGSRLLKQLESECRQRGIKSVFLCTQDYQALPFYLKHGFSIQGELADIPFEGTTRYYLVKKLR